MEQQLFMGIVDHWKLIQYLRLFLKKFTFLIIMFKLKTLYDTLHEEELQKSQQDLMGNLQKKLDNILMRYICRHKHEYEWNFYGLQERRGYKLCWCASDYWDCFQAIKSKDWFLLMKLTIGGVSEMSNQS